EPRLADTADAGQGHNAGRAEQTLNLGRLQVTPNEAAELQWQRVQTAVQPVRGARLRLAGFATQLGYLVLDASIRERRSSSQREPFWVRVMDVRSIALAPESQVGNRIRSITRRTPSMRAVRFPSSSNCATPMAMICPRR